MSMHILLQRLLLIVVLSMAVWGGVAQPSYAKDDKARYKPDQLVVKLDPAANVTIDDINATYGTTTLKALSRLAGIYLLQAPAGQDAKAITDAMEGDARLLFAEPNFINQAPEANPRSRGPFGGPDATPYPQQYAIQLLNLAQAQQINRGAGTIVAVIDTGVQLDHPALAGSLIPGYDFVDDDTTPDDPFNGPVDSDVGGHGTHVAGVIHLVAPEAQIMPVRVLDVHGDGNIFTLAEAIIYAAEHGANIINLSLGMPEKSNLLEEVTREATRHGLTVVGAAGNLNIEQIQYPAGAQCVLTITSIGPEGKKSGFANFGSWIDFAAPGDGIYSTLPASSYGVWSGTSMATPFVAGQAALLHSLSPSLNARQIAMLISGTTHSLDDANPDYKGRLGSGLVDISSSIQALQSGNLPDKNDGGIGNSCVANE
ncbi:MAG: S8 family serine peptidase [Anaerolineae bacterium]